MTCAVEPACDFGRVEANEPFDLRDPPLRDESADVAGADAEPLGKLIDREQLVLGNKLLADGPELDQVCRHLEIAESTWHRGLAQYGRMKASDTKRLKELEVENTRLKKLLADAELDKAMLKELAEGSF
jgi:hypothetical protein